MTGDDMCQHQANPV